MYVGDCEYLLEKTRCPCSCNGSVEWALPLIFMYRSYSNYGTRPLVPRTTFVTDAYYGAAVMVSFELVSEEN